MNEIPSFQNRVMSSVYCAEVEHDNEQIIQLCISPICPQPQKALCPSCHILHIRHCQNILALKQLEQFIEENEILTRNFTLNSPIQIAQSIYQKEQIYHEDLNILCRALSEITTIRYPELQWNDQMNNEMVESDYPNPSVAVPYEGEIKCNDEVVQAKFDYYGPFFLKNKVIKTKNFRPYLLNDGKIYVGSWKNGRKHGFGKLIAHIGLIYEGEWSNDIPTGQARYLTKAYEFTGYVINGLANGYGEITLADGKNYKGQWRNDQYEGYGVFTLPRINLEFSTITDVDGCVIKGQFTNGRVNGKAQLTWPIGHRYIGTFCNDQMQGKGALYFFEGGMYIGEFFHNKYHGQGILYDKNGSVIRKGQWNHYQPA